MLRLGDKMEPKYSYNLPLSISYFDCNDKIKAKAILDLFQDIATFHAKSLNMGFDDLAKINKCWILNRVKYQIIKNPTPLEIVTIETWPQTKNKYDSIRHYQILNKNGEVLVKGISKWCLGDMLNHKLSNFDDITFPENCLTEKTFENFDKIEQIDNSSLKFIKSYCVSFCDIDRNHHLNNACYTDIIFNNINEDAIKKYSTFQIDYSKECLLNDKIDLFNYTNNGSTFTIGKVNNKVCFISQIY
jgi:medium-chain acyl-[acyl-carrier-protein] hydrolase